MSAFRNGSLRTMKALIPPWWTMIPKGWLQYPKKRRNASPSFKDSYYNSGKRIICWLENSTQFCFGIGDIRIFKRLGVFLVFGGVQSEECLFRFRLDSVDVCGGIPKTKTGTILIKKKWKPKSSLGGKNPTVKGCKELSKKITTHPDIAPRSAIPLANYERNPGL